MKLEKVCPAICFWFAIVITMILKTFYLQSQINMNATIASGIAGSIVTIGLIILLLFYKRYNILMIIISILMSIVLFTDNIYYRYFENIASIERLTEFRVIGSITESIVSLIKINDFLYFIDLPFFISIMIFLKEIIIYDCSIKRKKVFFSLLICIVFILFINILNIKSTPEMKNDSYILNNYGVLHYHYVDILNCAKDHYKSIVNRINLKRYNISTDDNSIETKLLKKGLSFDEIAEFLNIFEKKNRERDNTDNKYRGFAKNHNLIMVQVEALQEFVINKTLNGKEITPNLNALIKDSLYFDEIYEQTYMGTTSDAELLSNVSIYPDGQQSANEKYSDNKYCTLAHVMKDAGYKTYAVHGNDGSFWNREKMFKAYGFEKFFDIKEFDSKEIIGLGISDQEIFTNILDKVDTEKPFYSFIITLSSHHPYSSFENYSFNDGFDVGKYKGSILGSYFNALHYTDMSIGTFIQELKDKKLYDNSLLIVYGDHKAIQYENKDLVEVFLGREFEKSNWNTIRKVPLIIHDSNIGSGINNVIGGQIDIMPTVLNLMGIDCPYYALGKDLNNTQKGYITHTVGFTVTDEYYYYWTNDEFYDTKTNKRIENQRYIDDLMRLRREVEISDWILNKDLFSVLY